MSNINIIVYTLGKVRTNCYIISNSVTKEAVIIDPADEANIIEDAVKKEELNVMGILLTHGHFDHILAAKELADIYNTKIYANEFEKGLLADGYKNCSTNMGNSLCTLVPDVLLKDEEIIVIADTKIQVIHTPGHTKGSVCYYLIDENILISGDTLFKDSVGRTDLPTGNNNMLLTSIHEKLMVLADDVTVFPGHGEPTTIGYEKKNNMYF